MDSVSGGGGGGEGETSASEVNSGGLQRVFYCHQCLRRTFPDAEHIDNFSCMNCGSGFIEDVTLREDSPSSQSDDQSWGGIEAANAVADSVESIVEGLEQWEDVAPSAAAASSSGNGRSGSRSRRPRARFHMTQSGGPISDQFIQSLIANLIGGPRGPGGAELPPGAIHISSAGGGGPRGLPAFLIGGGGGPSVPMMPLYGNPGDYAWGRGGLDAIVTQLLNQMDGTGPPPMSVDEIKKLPTVKVTQSQIDSNLQCSVCWDDFKLEEEVRQLKCEHIFHEDCIIPWLELHNTCPVCRTEQEENEANAEAGSNSEAGGNDPGGGGQPDGIGNGSSMSVGVSGAASRGPHVTSAARGGNRQASGRNAELMEALGRSMSVFNTLLGIPPDQQQQPVGTTTSSSQTSAPSGSLPSSRGPSTATVTLPTASTTSPSASSVSNTSTNQNNAGNSNLTNSTNRSNPQNQFHDMDLE